MSGSHGSIYVWKTESESKSEFIIFQKNQIQNRIPSSIYVQK